MARTYFPEDEDFPEGEERSKGLYYVKFDEERWLKYSAESQEQCKAHWRKRAKEAGIARAVLRLVPDPLFPMHGHEAPYTAWQENIEQECPEPKFEFSALIRTNTKQTRLSESEKAALFAQAPVDLAFIGAKVRVVNLDNQLLSEMELTK